MDKKHFRWGWIPLVGLLLVTPALWCLLVFTPTDVLGQMSWTQYWRLLLDDELFFEALIHTCLPPMIVGALVAVVALIVKKYVWDGQNHPCSQGIFYGLTGVAMMVVMVGAMLTSAVVEMLASFPLNDYRVLAEMAEHTGATSIGSTIGGAGALICLFFTILLLLVVYIADLMIPARTQSAPTVGLSRSFSVAQLVGLLCAATVTSVVVCLTYFRSAFLENAFSSVFDVDPVYYSSFDHVLTICLLVLMVAELVLCVLGLFWKNTSLAISVLVVSVITTLGLYTVNMDESVNSMSVLLEWLFGDFWFTEFPRLCLYLLDYRLFHLLALLCCVTAVWLRWPRKEKPPFEPATDSDGLPL